jgi:hypothetical protein
MQKNWGYRVFQGLAWILFIGACIKAGALLTTYGISLMINEEASKNLYEGLNLWGLREKSMAYYHAAEWGLIAIAVAKAMVLYLLVWLVTHTEPERPFQEQVVLRMERMGYWSLGAGTLTLLIAEWSKRLLAEGIDVETFNTFLQTGPEWLLLGAILLVLAQVFRKAVVLQSENELTI